MAFSDVEFRKLLRASAYWLAYRRILRGSDHLSERALTEPFSDFLGSTISPWVIRYEFNHPILNRKGARGRPKQIDFVLLSRPPKKTASAPQEVAKVAIETKWCPARPRDVLEDVVRLDLLVRDGTARYFVLAGYRGSVLSVLNRKANSGGKQVAYLGSILKHNGPSEYTVSASTLPAVMRKHIAAYMMDCGLDPDHKLAFSMLRLTRFETKLVNGFQLFGWRLKRVQGATPWCANDFLDQVM